MTVPTAMLSQRERELAAIIASYHEVTDQLKGSHETLNLEVRKLRLEVQRKNQELARRERLAALGEMATGVAHEIRNPLGSIQLYASLLQRDLAALPAAQKLARKIAAGVEALEKIVSEVLDFAGRHEPDPCQVAVELMVSNVVEIVTPQAARNGVHLAVHPSIVDHHVWVDRSQMEQAILNVVLNGIDAAGHGGTVRLSALADGAGTVLLQISDTGPGIAEDVRERIFNPFFTTKDSGTGLGLAIVHRILESHRGRVTVENLSEGGALFTLHLPGNVWAGRAPIDAEEVLHGIGPCCG